jgi:hypothetical protein
VDWIFDGGPRPRRASLSDVKIIMMFMRVLMLESLCQTVMGHISALKFLASGPCGSQWLRLVLSGLKWVPGRG